MGKFSILGSVWGLVWPNLLRSVIIILGIWFSARSFWSIYFVIIFINTLFDIVMTDKDKELSLARLLRMHAITFLFLGCIYLIYRLGGLWGVAGVFASGILVLVLLVSWSLYQQWPLFDAVTTWGANFIKGKTKDEFDLNEVLGRNGKK